MKKSNKPGTILREKQKYVPVCLKIKKNQLVTTKATKNSSKVALEARFVSHSPFSNLFFALFPSKHGSFGSKHGSLWSKHDPS